MEPNSASQRLRLLILTSSTGSGHDKRAEAIQLWLEKERTGEVEIKIEQIIENSSLIGRFGVWLYNEIQKRAPWLHNIYFFIVELFTLTHSGGVSYGKRYYESLIKAFRPTHLLSVHDSTNRGYFEDAKRILGEDRVRCMTYCGEYTGGYGFSRNWVNPAANLFFARTESCRDQAIRLGMAPDKIEVFQKVLPPIAFEERLSTDALNSFRIKLGFSNERLTLFLATGGFGANHHLAYLKALFSLADQVQVIVVCGRNEKVLAEVNAWSKAHSELKLHVEGFSQNMEAYFQLSDLVITRGGANSTTEALHYECPILYDAIGGLMPQEQCTVRYLVQQGLSSLIKSPAQLKTEVSSLLTNPDRLLSARKRLSELNPNESPTKFIQNIMMEEAEPTS